MKLFYRKYGKGAPFVIVHGLYGASDNWVSVAKVLADYFEVYVIDQRNHGHSPHSEEHNYKLLTLDLLEFLDTHEIQKAIFLGHSMGGKTVMFFAAEYPERVNRLIIADIAPKSYIQLHEKQLRSLNHDLIMDAMLSVDFSKVQKRENVEEQLSASIPEPRIRQFLLKNLHRNKNNTFEWILNLKALKNNLYEILDGLNVENFKNGYGVVGFPTLFLKGGNSDYITNEDDKLIRTIFTYAEIETIPNAGHWLHAEQPEIFVKKILEFIFGI